MLCVFLLVCVEFFFGPQLPRKLGCRLALRSPAGPWEMPIEGMGRCFLFNRQTACKTEQMSETNDRQLFSKTDTCCKITNTHVVPSTDCFFVAWRHTDVGFESSCLFLSPSCPSVKTNTLLNKTTYVLFVLLSHTSKLGCRLALRWPAGRGEMPQGGRSCFPKQTDSC